MNQEKLKEVIDNEFSKGDCIVAFLDILGFKNLVRKYVNSDRPEDKKIKEDIKSAIDDSFKNLRHGDNSNLKLIRYKIFSDCTCLSAPAYHNKEMESTILCLLMTIIVSYNFHLIRRNIYPRGGVSTGYHYEDKNMIFSEGLINAYDLEKTANYPRTILDKELVQRFKKLWKVQKNTIKDFGTQKKLIMDKKGITFINPFNLVQSMNKFELENIRRQFSTRIEFEKNCKESTMFIIKKY